MTSAYNKRPRVRGRVYESQKNGTSPVFVEWVQPMNAAVRVILTILGIIPLVGLVLLDWVKIGGGYLGVEEGALGLSKLSLVTSADELGELVIQNAFVFGDAATASHIASAAEFETWFMDFKMIFKAIAIVFVLALLFLFLSILFCKGKARAPLAYIGFGLGTVAPIMLFYAVIKINQMAEVSVLELTVFPFLAILTGLLSMIYCVRYPVATAVKDKRNFFLTRVLMSFLPVKGDGTKEGLRKVIFTTALVSFVYFGATLGVDLYKEWKAGQLQDLLRNKIGMDVDLNDEAFNKITKTAKPLPDYLALWRENNDMIGYIRVGDTKVDYPVLQTDTNEYYLEHDFYGEPSKGGSICADTRNNFEINDLGEEELSGNTILYGHNIATGNYFAALSNYYRETVDGTLTFYKTNPVIDFHTLYEKHEWKVFACVLFNTQPDYGDVIRYWDNTEFYSEDVFNNYILTVMERSILLTDVDVEYGDNLLTLSTCYWPYGQVVDTRCVVFARRVRDGESRDVDLEKAKYNRRALRFTEEERRIGTMYPGYMAWHTCTYFKSYKGKCLACEND